MLVLVDERDQLQRSLRSRKQGFAKEARYVEKCDAGCKLLTTSSALASLSPRQNMRTYVPATISVKNQLSRKSPITLLNLPATPLFPPDLQPALLR